MNKSTEIKINKIELVNVPDDVFNEFLKELTKSHEQYVLDDGFYVKLLKFNYDTLRKLNIDARKLKIIEKRYKTTQTPATPPEYLSNILLLEPKRAEPLKSNLAKKIFNSMHGTIIKPAPATPPFLNCMTCKNALHTNLAAINKDGINVRALKKETWTQEICLKCKDYSNYKLK